jgi:hypothetical protein
MINQIPVLFSYMMPHKIIIVKRIQLDATIELLFFSSARALSVCFHFCAIICCVPLLKPTLQILILSPR